MFYVFKLAQKPDESEVATQTDYLLEKPICPKYLPEKVGRDIGTQIESGEVRAFNISFLQDFIFKIFAIKQILLSYNF